MLRGLGVSPGRDGWKILGAVWGVCRQHKLEQECSGGVDRDLKLLEDVWRTIRGSGRG